MTQRILVTGGAGFIGSHTVDLLLAQNKEVVVLDNLSSGKLANLNLTHPNLEFIEGDVLEFPLVEDLLANCDAVLHLAAIASVAQSIEDPIYTFQVNTQGFLHVLEAVHRANRYIRLVFASSAAVYGEAKNLPCEDNQPLVSQPLSPYALQKWQDEEYANLYARLHGVQSLALRYFNVYGERQDPASSYSGVISRFVDAYQANRDLTIYGNGSQSRDFIYIADVAHANVLALESKAHSALNIATGTPQTLLDLIASIENVGKKPAKIVYEPARPGDIQSSFASISTAKHQLHFQAQIDLRAGIERIMTA